MSDSILISFVMIIHNGEKYLSKTLNNFSQIKYQNCELIILDNLSTDNTAKIALSYVKNDKRIKYIKDTKRRDGFEAANVIVNYAQGKYLKYFSDDDYVDVNIIKYYEKILLNSNVKILYFNGRYIDPNDQILNKINRKKFHIYKKNNNSLKDLFYFLLNRNCLCILYGFFEIEFLKSLPPQQTFDATGGADVDNIRVAYLLINFHSLIHYDEKEILYIRKEPIAQINKPNSFDEELEEKWHNPKFGKLSPSDSALYIKYIYLIHELKVFFKIIRLILSSKRGIFFKFISIPLTVLSFLIYPIIKLIRKLK